MPKFPRRRGASTFCLLLLLTAAAQADMRAWPGTVAADVRTGVSVSWQLLRAPAHGQAADYALAGALAVGILASTRLDQSVRAEVSDWTAGPLETVDDIGYAFGRAYTTLGAGGALYATGLIGEVPALKRTGQEIIEAFFLAHLGTQAVKHVLGRYRPYNEHGPFRFEGLTSENRYLSFPSGDVTSVCALTTVLAEEIRHPAASVALYGLAGMTYFQRLHDDRHWFSDVTAAAIWSTAVSRAVVHYHRKLGDASPGVRLQPEPAGLRLIWNF